MMGKPAARVLLMLTVTLAFIALYILLVQASEPAKPGMPADTGTAGDHGALDRHLAPLAPSNGRLPIAIVAAPDVQNQHVMARDGQGGAIIAWTDGRPFPGGLANETVIYAQRVVSAAVPTLWANDGVPVILLNPPPYENSHHVDPAIVSDDAGGAIVGWCNNGHVYAQRLDGDGARLWHRYGVTVTQQPSAMGDLVMAADGAGGAFLIWGDDRERQPRLYAQRMNADGVVLWPNEVPLFTAGPQQRTTFNPAIVADGSGGAVIAWKDYRDHAWADIYAQRVTGDGVKLWGIDGTPVITDPDTDFDRPNVTLVADGGGGAFVVWEDYRETHSTGAPIFRFNRNIFCQHLESNNGQRTWDTQGLRLSDLMLEPCGWGGGPPCGATIPRGGAVHPAITRDVGGGFYVAWSRSQTIAPIQYSIRAQRVTADGTILWSPPLTQGLHLSPGFVYPEQPAIAPDGVGGAFVAWQCKNAIAADYDLCVQRINGAGDLLCGGGANIANLGGVDVDPVIVAGQAGQSIVAWNNQGNIYAQLVDDDCNGEWQGKADVMIRDNAQDDGTVPSPQPWWDSPDIWVRHEADNGTQHQNPVQGQENTVYVQAHNIGTLPVADVEVHLYWAEPGLGMEWPGDWHEISPGETIASLSAGASRRVAIPWSPPRSGHFCLLVRLVTADDPITAEGDAPGDNNLAQKNVEIVELGGGARASKATGAGVLGTQSVSFDVANVEAQPVAADVIVERTDFCISGTLVLDLGADLYERWVTATGGTLDGAEVVAGRTAVQVTSPVSATILGLPLEAQERTPVTMTITGPATDRNWLYVNVWERVDGETIGGNILRAPLVYILEETAKTASAVTVSPGDVVTYTVSLVNEGNRDVPHATLTDTLPLALTYKENSLESSAGVADFAQGRVQWSGPISLTQPTTITYAAVLAASASDGQLITNTVTVNDGLKQSTERWAVVEVQAYWDVYLPLVLRSH